MSEQKDGPLAVIGMFVDMLANAYMCKKRCRGKFLTMGDAEAMVARAKVDVDEAIDRVRGNRIGNSDCAPADWKLIFAAVLRRALTILKEPETVPE